jgi:hypothetical protein
VADGDEGALDAAGPPCGDEGENAGAALAVPVTSVGMGTVCGIPGAEVRGWMGMGVVCGASRTGVAAGEGIS